MAAVQKHVVEDVRPCLTLSLRVCIQWPPFWPPWPGPPGPGCPRMCHRPLSERSLRPLIGLPPSRQLIRFKRLQGVR